eukprot:TRINITY_DN943_c0_g1_i4.p1 TRINITY_DN943_c0_g1~~TRINITY_DN943_c0_g1_i4.p1  ORF type:complete len:154 (+),score=5.77 TRINITY_DN943_c0_g1_i4:142-603(+)
MWGRSDAQCHQGACGSHVLDTGFGKRSGALHLFTFRRKGLSREEGAGCGASRTDFKFLSTVVEGDWLYVVGYLLSLWFVVSYCTSHLVAPFGVLKRGDNFVCFEGAGAQRRGVSELLVEVGDQRRSIAIPVRMQGKVAGAKFEGKTLTVTLRK